MSEKTGLFTRNKEFIEQNSEKSVISSLLQLTSYTKKKDKNTNEVVGFFKFKKFFAWQRREGGERKEGGGGRGRGL